MSLCFTKFLVWLKLNGELAVHINIGNKRQPNAGTSLRFFCMIHMTESYYISDESLSLFNILITFLKIYFFHTIKIKDNFYTYINQGFKVLFKKKIF